MREYINKVKNFEQFFNEGLKDYQLNNILDKITDNGIDSLSNHEKTLLKSYSDKSIDVKKEIKKHIDKYQTAKNVIKTIPLETEDEELEKDIGRYVRLKKDKKLKKQGLLVSMGMIFEIVSIQKHWGRVDGIYVFNKIGYRIAEVGNKTDFGRVGDIDKVEFLNITEDEAVKINKKINSDIEMIIYPK